MGSVFGPVVFLLPVCWLGCFLYTLNIHAHFSPQLLMADLLFGHKLHIGAPYHGKRFLTRQIPTSCLPTWLVFIHIEHICTFFSATIDGRNLIFGHKLHIGTPYRGKRFLTRWIPTSCLPKSGGSIGSQFILLNWIVLCLGCYAGSWKSRIFSKSHRLIFLCFQIFTVDVL